MQYWAFMGVSSLPVVGAKMAFSVHTQWKMWNSEKWNRHENDVGLYCGPSLCFVNHVCTESAIFAPATGRLDKALTAVYGIFRWKNTLKYYINMVLCSR